MKQKRLLLVLLLTVLTGSLAGYSALRYLQQQPTSMLPVPDSRRAPEVVVAARDLPVGHMMSEDDVITVRWPPEAVPAGYLGSPGLVVGRGLITAVRRHEPVLDGKLASPGSGGGLPIVIPEGMRALAVRVDEVVGVAGFVLPGTRVDVLLTITPNTGSQEPVTRIILQNVQALTAGQAIQRDDDGKAMTVPVVTLLVLPEQAERLVLATTQGRIHLALRSMLDVDEVSTSGARVASLLQESGAEPPRRVVTGQAPTRPVPTTTIIESLRGGTRTLIEF